MKKSEKKLEKKEIQSIVNEIDTIMFGAPMKLRFNKFKGVDLVGGTMGALCAAMIASGFEDTKVKVASVGVGFAVGTIISCASHNETHYYMYEKAYLNLSRANQVKVLDLVEKLVKLLELDIKNDKNKKYVEKYLDLDKESTMFNNFENNHPHFEILSQEKIDEIHERDKLTPEESYNDWISHVCAPGDHSGSAAWRCKKYGNCRDCLVAYAMEQEEWNPLRFIPTNIFDREVDYDCDPKSEVVKSMKKE